MDQWRFRSGLLGMLERRFRRLSFAAKDLLWSSHGPLPNEEPEWDLLSGPLELVDVEGAHELLAEADSLCRHRFGVFGRAGLDVGYDADVPGREGHRWESALHVCPDKDGHWLKERVNVANRLSAAERWSLISDGPFALPDYKPIDWQRDPVSGYRWDGRLPALKLAIAPARGADIKAAWQSARMQHLPRLALAAHISQRRGEGERAQRFAAEVRAQVLDFLAANPPRHGVQWRSVMEVAIRGGNICLAFAILSDAALAPEPLAGRMIAVGLRDHAQHTLKNLEWSETARGNHYLADLFGLALMAHLLPDVSMRGAARAFVADQVSRESLRQFLPDGGSFEGSTGYHRLSAECVLWTLAVLTGAWRRDPSWTKDFSRCAIRPRPGMPQAALSVGMAPVPDVVLERLGQAISFANDMTHLDGTAVLIGDDDSGRPIDLEPSEGPDGARDPRCRDGLQELGRALLAPDAKPTSAEGLLLRNLAGGPLPTLTLPQLPVAASPMMPLVAVDELLESVPAAWRRRLELPVQIKDSGNWVIRVYPDFGVVLAQRDEARLVMRCFDPALIGEAGHSHDDNLAIDLDCIDGPKIYDPGSRCYTPFPEWRETYRGILAHAAPRPEGRSAISTKGLFHLSHLARATLLHASPAGIAGRMDGADWQVLRLVRLRSDAVIVEDACLTGPLAPLVALSDPLAICRGYDEPTNVPAFRMEAVS